MKNLLFKLTHWESWHYHIKYIPLIPFWIWYCIKARSWWFFSASNPSITFGGFEGEGKMEIYKQLPDNSYPQSVLIEPQMTFEEVLSIIEKNKFSFPFAVKPDRGLMGLMFRRINSIKDIERYHHLMPMSYLIQKWVDYPIEVSVFYYRMPNAKSGEVSGYLMKEMPKVIGDGTSTLKELILASEDLKYQSKEILTHHRSKLDKVLAKGKNFILSYASNRSQGGKLVSLSHEIDKKLLEIFDSLSHRTRYFYYGRYDIKCANLNSLKNGKDFSILEYNGAGAGVQHIYGNKLSLWKAWGIILNHWQMLYRISSFNHKVKKVPYWEHSRGRRFLREARQNAALLKKLDSEFTTY